MCKIMDSSMAIEILGYIASALIFITFMMKEPVKLRLIGLIGCTAFCIYGFLIHSYPTALMNIGCSAFNAYYFFKLIKK